MKTPDHKAKHRSTKSLTFGQLVEATFGACGEELAPKVLQLAFESHLVRFK